MTRNALVILIIIVAGTTGYYTSTTSSRTASILFINGNIYSLDPSNTVGEALAINGSRIVGIGSNEELMELYDAETIIDLKGKTVMPGLIDGHGHVLGEGSKLHNLDLTGSTSASQIAELVRLRTGDTPAGQWIYGRGWDQNDWEIKDFPVHEILDRVAPSHPVVLTRIDGHAVWVNTRAIELAGVTSETKDPEGGKIYHDAKGNPTGIFVDNAIDLIDKVIPPLTDAQVEERLKLSLAECVSLGLTEVHDMGVDLQTIRIYKKLIDRDECPIRIYAAIGGDGETWKHYLQTGKEIGYGEGYLTVRAVKLYVDGALGSRGAALIDDYSDDHGNRGLTRTSEAEMEKVCREAAENGFQVCTHAIGDRGNNITLNVYEKVLSTIPKDQASPRWRIEHAQILQQSDIPRFAKLGVIPSMQPTHATSDMYWAESRLGAQRITGAYAWRSLLQNGSFIISGSDFPVEGVNPLWGYYAAVTRSDQSGYPQDGWYAQQKMTREEAAKSFTQWPSAGAFEESMKGTIEPGKWADVTILSNDIMKVSPKEILSTDVEMTMVGGKIVYQKPETALAQ